MSNSSMVGVYPTAEDLVATFTVPVSNVHFALDDEGYNGRNNLGALLTSGALNSSDFVSNIASDQNVAKIVWDDGYSCSNWTQALTTLSYLYGVAVPEPAALSVFGTALLGLLAAAGSQV